MNKPNSSVLVEAENLRKAKEWEDKMIRTGSYRNHFFKKFTHQINSLFDKPSSFLEVGSGPGHLAECILKTGKVKEYTLFDLSESMNHLALQRLEKYQSVLKSTVGDFLSKSSYDNLGLFDAVLCMQSIHEVSDKKLAVSIYNNIFSVIKPNGYFLVCDFIFGDPGMQNDSMYMTPDEQKKALEKSEFKSVKLISNHQGLTLYVAQKGS